MLFSSKGYKQTTLKDISSECGMNSALISYYFGGKKGLLRSVLELKLKRFEEVFSPVELAGSEITMQDFLAFIASVLEDCETDPSILQISKWSVIDNEESSAKLSQDVCSVAETKIAKAVQFLNPNLNELECMSRVLMIGSFIQKYSELLWSGPDCRSFPFDTTNLNNTLKDQILDMVPTIIHKA